MEVEQLTLSIEDDLDGSAMDLREWLQPSGSDDKWTLLPPGPSEGQGLAETITIALEATAASMEICNRVTAWMKARGKRAKTVTICGVVAVDGKTFQLTGTLTPLE